MLRLSQFPTYATHWEKYFLFFVATHRKTNIWFGGNLICKKLNETQVSNNEKSHSSIFLSFTAHLSSNNICKPKNQAYFELKLVITER